MTKVIALFNHKGGVSKTTTVFHLGWKMAAMGKRVLMVDADPQCNLTGLTLGLEDYDSLFKFYDSKQNTDIFNSLAPLFALPGFALPGNAVSGHLGAPSIAKTNNPNLFILAGNIKFSEIDIQIATALTSSGTIPVLKPFVGAINKLIRDTATLHNIDVVLVDMSPSVSATNHCILMGSDYFIIPISPDFYCYQAIDSLSNVLPKWVKDITPFKNTRHTHDPFALPDTNPQLLGLISQHYRIYTTEEDNDQKTMAKAYREWLEKIKKIATSKLVPALKKDGVNMIVDEAVFRACVAYDTPYHLAGIQNFSGLIPVSQKLSKPIFELTQQDGKWGGGVWEHTNKDKEYGVKFTIQEAGHVYSKLSESVIRMIEATEHPHATRGAAKSSALPL